MAYTRSWTDTTPADSDQASTLGLQIRNLRTDIEERMDTLLDGHWDEDPVGGFPITVVENIAALEGRESSSGWQLLNSDGSELQPGGPGSANKWVQLKLKTGYILTKVRAAVFITSGAAGSPHMKIAQVVVVPAGGGVAGTQISTGSVDPSHDSTWHWAQAAALSPYTVQDGDVILVQVQGNTGAGGVTFDVKYAGLEVTYSVPNLIATL